MVRGGGTAAKCSDAHVPDDSASDGDKSTRYIRQLNPETKATLDALSKEYKDTSSAAVS